MPAPVPVYTTLADLQTFVGGEAALKLIADPDFNGDSIDTEIVNHALSWGEGEILKLGRGVAASGVDSWESSPASIPSPAKDAILTLGVFGVHERIRAAQGVAIPRESIAAKDRVYKEMDRLRLGEVSWVSGTTPAQHLTQSVRVYTDANGRGRQTLTTQLSKLIR